MQDTHEIWKYISNTHNLYSVSNMGRVYSHRSNMVLTPIYMDRGYTKVNLHVDGKRKGVFIHRLVATEFIPNPENKPEVNHINAIHDDNRLCNLEWVTQEENLKHAYDMELIKHKDDRYGGYLYHVWRKHHKTDNWCAEWQDYLKFYDWCINNGYKDGLHICRHDTLKLFSADNCYIDNITQHPKTPKHKRKHRYMCFGEEMLIEELADKYDMRIQTIVYRLSKGMNIEEAVTKPLNTNGRPRKAI